MAKLKIGVGRNKKGNLGIELSLGKHSIIIDKDDAKLIGEIAKELIDLAR